MHRSIGAFVACFLGIAYGFNLDLNHSIVYKSDQQADLFGYSLGMYPGSSSNDQPWILIGAPKANNARLPNSPAAGTVYKCEMKGVCQQIYFEREGKTRWFQDKHLRGAMIGGTIDVSADRFVVCSPNWMSLSSSVWGQLKGACYLGLSKLIGNSDTVQTLVPLWNALKGGGNAGTSACLSAGTKGAHDLLVGAPFYSYRKGVVATYKDADPSKSMQPVFYGSGDSVYLGYAVTSGRFFSSAQLVNVAGAPATFPAGQAETFTSGGQENHQVLVGEQLGEYFGASLAAGDINGDGLDDLVVGAPQYTNFRQGQVSQDEGRVFVYFGSTSGSFVTPEVNAIIKGKDFNGRLGTTVTCVGDLDSDGYQDFAFAAPYSDKGTGSVLIYNGSPQGLVLSQKLNGAQLAQGVAGFGYGISRGQDVDNNGFSDVAIGAYKSGHAFVIRSKPVVELSATIAFEDIKLTTEATDLKTLVCINYKGPKAPSNISVSLSLTFDNRYKRIYLERGSQTSDSVTRILQVPRKGECFPFNFKIKTTSKSNYLQPIKFSGALSLALENGKNTQLLIRGSKVSGEDKFCQNCPTMRVSSVNFQAEKGFFLGCAKEDACVANLQLEGQFYEQANVELKDFLVGSQDHVYFKLTVLNSGDPAFNSKLLARLPSAPATMPPSCSNSGNGSESTLIECDAGNPLRKNDMREFVFLLSTTNVDASVSSIQIDANVTSETPLEKAASILKSMNLKYEADITVYGASSKEQHRFELTKEDYNKSQVAAEFLYQVEKFGLSPLKEVALKIDVPVALKNGNAFLKFTKPMMYVGTKIIPCEPNEFEATEQETKKTVRTKREEQALDSIDMSKYPENRTLFVNCSSGDFQCTQIVCRVEIPNSNPSARLALNVHIDMFLLDSQLGSKDIVVLNTAARVEITRPPNVEQPSAHRPDVAHVPLVLLRSVPVGKVELWVIIASSVGGILLLILVTAVLVKLGFFKREMRDELLAQKATTNQPNAPLGNDNPSLETNEF